MDLAERLEDRERSRALFCWNINIAASNPEQTRLRAALAREDLFTVVVDLFPTDTTDYADIVLPAASFLECDDIVASYFHLSLGAQVKAVEPLGEALPNSEIFRRLAAAMGFDEPQLFESDARGDRRAARADRARLRRARRARHRLARARSRSSSSRTVASRRRAAGSRSPPSAAEADGQPAPARAARRPAARETGGCACSRRRRRGCSTTRFANDAEARARGSAPPTVAMHPTTPPSAAWPPATTRSCSRATPGR